MGLLERFAPTSTPPEPSDALSFLATTPDPLQLSWHLARANGYRLHIGAMDNCWLTTREERSLLVLGPPRDAGKTTAVLVPAVLATPTPLVAASTKDDVFRATALARALLGRLWHFAPDGTEPTPPGARKLR